ncbi:MAG: histidine phosphatase family protein [Pirellulaceae bacterium]|nr:histidine phosphatase family protein [Pirellulaceae bacterium]
MSTLTLVRHGQATPFEDNPDRLSTLGQTQARALGLYWLNNNVVFDEVYTGTLTRQQHTAQLVGEVFQEADQPWPTAQVMAEFDEYHVDVIWKQLAPELVKSNSSFAELFAAYQRNRNGPNHHRTFQLALEAVMRCWQEGTLVTGDVEGWTTFRDRVRQGIRHILEQEGSRRRVAVFTSGGPIGTTIQWALNAPDQSALEVNWRVRNCSLTEFVFSRDRLTLDSFNALPHLEDQALWSYR